MLSKITIFSLSLLLTGNSIVGAESCQNFFVTATDGYVNIRSYPQIQGNNVIATLPSGSSVQLSEGHQKWLKIKLPLAGWLAGSQISRISCDQGRDLLIELGLPTIIKLGKKAANGYQKDAETLVKMSPYIDGIVEENYATVIVQWANQNPKFLVAILDRQSPTIHRAVLSSLDFGLVTNTNERKNLEKFMQNISPKSLTYVDWYRRNPVYP
ncbi:hypothetical protein [Microcystis aeruginosa]|uniref:hypothetical protein n=1 Tax=Microcystis aeruginosa TaxID=1126 RepID=UPI00232BD0EA|nr:hypothetical protein [Microcystis aeruginosa]MDB9390507.1 hypothetical protein [Microcystis aeruginosa CS-579]